MRANFLLWGVIGIWLYHHYHFQWISVCSRVCYGWKICKKYRKSYWIITYIIQRKILKRFESKIKEEHAEFRPGRPWIDRINTPGIIIDHSGEFQLQLNMVFMGFQRAFDTINHDCMWITQESQGIHTKIINLIQGL